MAQPKRIRTVEGSCWKCKSRRVKCDLKKPCSKCISGNFACSYGKRIRYQIFEPLNMKKDKRKTTKEVNSKVEEIPKVHTEISLIHRAPILTFTMDQQVMYFEKILSPKLTVYGYSMKIENSFIFQDPLLSTFIGAVSSAHKMIDSGDESSLAIVNSSRCSAISEFRQKIIGLTKRNINVLFAGNVFLCLLDGVIYPKDDFKTAFLHLQGGRAILNSMGNSERQLEVLSDSISIMMLSYFGTIDLTNCILTGSCPHFTKNFWFRFGGKNAWWGTVTKDDSFLEILGALTDISNCVAGADSMSLEDLLSFQSFFERKVQRSESSNPWETFCSAFSLTGLIYIYRKICGFNVNSELIQAAVADCTKNINQLKDCDLQHCLLFPLLIVGCHCVNPEHQELIRQAVIRSYSHLTFGNVRILWRFLEEKWYSPVKRLMPWCDDFKEISETVFLF